MSARAGSGTEPAFVQICPCYVDFSKETGGVANIVRKMSTGLAARGHSVTVLCGNRELCRTEAQPGAQRIVPGLTQHVFFQRKHPLLGPTQGLVRALRSMPVPMVAHVHTCFSAFTESAMLALAELRIPFLFTPHGKLTPEFLRQHRLSKLAWWRSFGRRAVRQARRIVLSNRREAESLSRLGLPADFDVVPNGFNPETLNGAEPGLPPAGQPYLLFLGYLDPRKQPEDSNRCWAHPSSGSILRARS